MLLEEVPSATSCKHDPDTITCYSLSGMKKLLSVFGLPWDHPSAGHVQCDKPKSRKEDSAVPSVALLKLSAEDLHMLKVIEEATEKPWYRQSYSSFPKPKAHDIVVKKPCMTYHMAWHLRSVPEVSPLL